VVFHALLEATNWSAGSGKSNPQVMREGSDLDWPVQSN
jgi:hypothetical protein